VVEAVELAVSSRIHEGRDAVLRRHGGGATRNEWPRRGWGDRRGGRRRRRARARVRRGGGGSWRVGAHIICGIHVGALGDEVLEAVELAFVSK